MERRALPLMVDALPLYADKERIIAAIAIGARGQKFASALFQLRDFPRPSAIMDGLYFVPAVIDAIAQYEAGRQSLAQPLERTLCDQTSKRPASRGDAGPAGLKFRTG